MFNVQHSVTSAVICKAPHFGIIFGIIFGQVKPCFWAKNVRMLPKCYLNVTTFVIIYDLKEIEPPIDLVRSSRNQKNLSSPM
jgi:hypothetical protein